MAARTASAVTGVLVVNAGSSSLKLSVLELGRRGHRRAATWTTGTAAPDHRELRWFLASCSAGRHAAGHRVVHGGRRYTAPRCIDDEVVRPASPT